MSRPQQTQTVPANTLTFKEQRESVWLRLVALEERCKDPLQWECIKKHTHTTRTCKYSFQQPTWSDVLFLLDELYYRADLLAAEEVNDY